MTAVKYGFLPLMPRDVTRGPQTKNGCSNTILRMNLAACLPSGHSLVKKEAPAHTGATTTAVAPNLPIQINFLPKTNPDFPYRKYNFLSVTNP